MQSTVFTRMFTILSFLAAFLILPNEINSQSKKKNKYSSISYDDGTRTITIKDGTRDYKIEYDGEITLSKDDKDVVEISRGGFLEIRKSRFGKRRRIVIEAEGGKLIKKYFIGWKEVPFKPEGKKWLAEILPDLVKRTTIAAKSRVDRFYRKGGAKRVMSEVKDLESDYVKAAYTKILLEKNLSTTDLVAVLDVVGTDIKSDYYTAQILKSNQKAFLASNKTKDAYIKAAGNIKSDYYQAQIMKTVISDNSINDKQMGELLKMCENIKSSYYKSQILTSIMSNRELNTSNMNAIMELSNSIKSDYYKSQILRKALKKNNLSSANYERFLNSISTIKSSHYLSQIINDMMISDVNGTSLTKLLSIVNKNINSDHYATTIYKKLAKNDNLTESQLIEIIEAAGNNIGSAYYLSNTLTAFASKVKNGSKKLKEAYASTAKKINSDTYFGRAMKAIY